MIAIGILTLTTGVDRALAGFAETYLGFAPGLLITGSVAGLVFAYVARFLTAAFNATHSGLEKIHPSLDAAARSLGAAPGRVLRAVHIPLLRGALASAALLVFIDVMKELPATLIMRPFNFRDAGYLDLPSRLRREARRSLDGGADHCRARAPADNPAQPVDCACGHPPAGGAERGCTRKCDAPSRLNGP